MTATVDVAAGPGSARRSAPPLRAVAAVVAVGPLWWVLDQTLPRGLPPGIVVSGAVFGAIYALNAIGLVLVFRANRVVNFAQAEFGVVAAVLAIQFVLQWDWNFYAAVAAGLVIAALVAGLIEATVIRRFSRAPRLILAVVTIALAQVLAGLAQVIPLYWKGDHHQHLRGAVRRQLHRLPRDLRRRPGPGPRRRPRRGPRHSAAFLRWSPYGMAIRAAAENGDRARLLGIPVPRLSTIVWTVAGVLSALAVLLRVCVTGFSSFSSVTGGGSSLLLFTLAAAVIGGMERLPTTVVAAVALGVFQEAVIWNWSNTTLVDATPSSSSSAPCSSSGTPSPGWPRRGRRRGRRCARCGPSRRAAGRARGALGRPRPEGGAPGGSGGGAVRGQSQPARRRLAGAHLRHGGHLALRPHRPGRPHLPRPVGPGGLRGGHHHAPVRALRRRDPPGHARRRGGGRRGGAGPRPAGAAHPRPLPGGDHARLRRDLGHVLPPGAVRALVHRAAHRPAGGARPAVARERHHHVLLLARRPPRDHGRGAGPAGAAAPAGS